MRKKSEVHRAVLMPLALVVAFSVAGAAAATWNVSGAFAVTRKIIRSHEVLSRVERALSLLEGIETRVRVYLQSGNPREVKLIRGDVTALGLHFDRLSAVARDNERREACLARVRDLVGARLATLREAISIYEQAGQGAALARLPARLDKDFKEQIGKATASLRDTEEAVLQKRVADSDTTMSAVIILAASLAAPHLVLVWFSHGVFARELKQRRALQGRLENLAMTDPLTGLANRRAVESALQSALSRARRHGSHLSVILLDVDHFKHINDRFGHAAGDSVLRSVARALVSAVRAEDLAGRYGGEEFLAVLPEADETGSVGTAERIRTAVKALSLPGPPVTISLGVTTLRAQCATAAALVSEADQALFTSKRSGRDRVTHFHRKAGAGGDSARTAPVNPDQETFTTTRSIENRRPLGDL
jgi:diguanylate cyclase (GGDEF)-like protein